ncbi:MAG: leucine-rich repeat domain-containing protein, partial [Clostridia bacterium]|nr:leucine-rich repeat domain-containing protein [Clostridia bacterium]
MTGCRLPLRTALFVQKNSGGEIVKNSRKTILILACLGAICLLVFGLTACNNSSPHIHNYVNLECVNCGETSTECFSFTLLRDGTYEITVKNANNLPSNIKIPAIYNKKAVTSIGSYAFSGCSSLTSIEIPNSVTLIGERAFGVCGSLTLVVIPDSVTSIGSGAFNGCSGLTSVVIGNSVTSIGSYAFFDCYKLVEVINNSPYITVAKGDLSNGFIGYYA